LDAKGHLAPKKTVLQHSKLNMKIPKELLTFVENHGVLETYVDSVGMNSCGHNLAQIELCVTRPEKFDPDHPPAQQKYTKHPVCRLVMPIEAMGELLNSLQGLLTGIAQQRHKGVKPESN
jgi:hypothetical protein